MTNTRKKSKHKAFMVVGALCLLSGAMFIFAGHINNFNLSMYMRNYGMAGALLFGSIAGFIGRML